MPEKKIADYVEKNLKRGIGINEIKKALSKAGWSKEEIEQGINLLNDKPSDPNFRDNDYSKYLSDDKKRNKKVITFVALVLIILVVLGYFFFPRYEVDIEKNIKNQDESIAGQESENQEILQTQQNQEDNGATQEEPLVDESPQDEEQNEPAGCVEKYYKMCYFGDVYWYDSCYQKGELVEECSGDCINGTCVGCDPKIEKRCYAGDLYWYDSCDIRGEKAEECEYGCIEFRCKRQNEGEMIDCGTDVISEENIYEDTPSFDCFIEEAYYCSPAEMKSKIKIILFGVEHTTDSTYKIKGMEDGKCIFYIRTDNIDLTFPEGTPQETIDEQNEIYDALEGRDGECKFEKSDLTSMLERWKGGNYDSGETSCSLKPGGETECITEGGDFGNAECSGTYFINDL
ncbi:MAG: hypothetical protein PHV16_00445 [Candidatus Nanoarchaeia archaeon]|nr:hypothetical protein [Candidatus Nanoarchaeia archaeon]